MNTLPSVTDTLWSGEPAVDFSAGGFRALLVPGLGGSLIELADAGRGLSLLRRPPDAAALRERPMVWGIPVLFPPNRIRDGVFSAGGRRYQLPINTRDSNHCHGLLCRLPWEVTDRRADTESAEVELAFISRPEAAYFSLFPHEFEYRLRYTLTSRGLLQGVSVKNTGKEAMPLGAGFHTAFTVPFAENGSAEACRLRVSVGRRWELDGRNLPTGKLFPRDARAAEYGASGIRPAGADIEEHYTAEPLTGSDGSLFHGAVLSDSSVNLSVRYEVGPSFGHWMIWNGRNEPGFVCPEPMTWMIDAPNIGLPPGMTGFRMLAPGDSWSDTSRISVETGTPTREPRLG